MSRITIQLPAVLAQMVDGERSFGVCGATLAEALRELVRQRPILGAHLFDEAGDLRRHIRCFCNGEVLHGAKGLEATLRPGDRIRLLSSVSGG